MILVEFEVKDKEMQYFYGVVNMSSFDIESFSKTADKYFVLDDIGKTGLKSLNEVHSILDYNTNQSLWHLHQIATENGAGSENVSLKVFLDDGTEIRAGNTFLVSTDSSIQPLLSRNSSFSSIISTLSEGTYYWQSNFTFFWGMGSEGSFYKVAVFQNQNPSFPTFERETSENYVILARNSVTSFKSNYLCTRILFLPNNYDVWKPFVSDIWFKWKIKLNFFKNFCEENIPKYNLEDNMKEVSNIGYQLDDFESEYIIWWTHLEMEINVKKNTELKERRFEDGLKYKAGDGQNHEEILY
ncbi:hypothetical protein BCR32DRAFT_277153 [Anaeromyces robustus]|uniref:Uncharacterized protein n=1 Tax=Anaeromyces robustus TaxID=1754192 RepID=A0A1Y1XFG9_9FUNG|nr:hypothetical protein BCR32DRAFT_277153 [Anaeromyces robustus]|eukprot:ORX84457.1 hypothetical protein BCR32DRAFT_277153 [Anaeromyces robustus]